MGSFPSDLTMKVNIDPASAIANFKKIEESIKKGAQGIAGEYEKAAKIGQDMAKQMIDVSSRAGRQLETQLRSIEKQTVSLGKTQVEMNEMQRTWMLERARGLKNQEEQEKRINTIYDQRRKYFQEEERRQQSHGGGTGSLLFRGARDIFEGRMTYGVMDIGRAALNTMQSGAAGGAGAAGAAGGAGLLAGISTTALAVGGLTAAFVGVEAAGYAAAKAVGEYGREVHDVQIKTGMTAVEVQRLQFAAQVTGQDISIVDRMMRGLTMAIEGTDKKAFAAAKTLKNMGVDLVALHQGGVKPLELLQQISTALEAQPDKWLRNKEAIDLMGRAGIQSLPMIVELNKAVRESGKLDFFNQDAIDRMKETNTEIVIMETKLKLIKLHLEELVAKPFIITINVVGTLADLLGKGMGQKEKPDQGMPDIPDDLIGRFRVALGTEKAAERAPYAAATQYAKELQKNSLEAAEQELSLAKEAYDQDLKGAALGTVKIGQLMQDEAAYKKIKDHVEAMRQAESDRKTIKEAIRKLDIEAKEREEHPYEMLAADRKLKDIAEMHGVSDADKAKAAEYIGPLRLEEVQMLIQRGINQGRAATQQVAEALGVEQKPSAVQFAAATQMTMAARNREYLLRLKQEQEETREALRPLLAVQTEQRKNEEASALRGVRLGGILQPQNIETRLAAEAQIAQIRERAANQEAEDAKTRLSYEYTSREQYEHELLAIKLKNEGEVDKAREEYQAKYLEELRHQVDEIKGKIEPLYETLFTHPTKFAGQLRSTITQAALHPITSGLSEMTATALHPLIFGAGGTGGIAGGFRSMFGGGRLNDVHLINGAVPVHIVGAGGGGFSGGGGGGGGGGFFSGGGGGGGFSGGGGDGGYSSGGGIGTSLYDLPMRGGAGGMNLAGMALASALGIGGGTAGGGGGTGGGAPQNAVMASIQSTIGKYIGGSYAGSGGLGRVGTNMGQYLSALGSAGATTAAKFSALSTGPFAGTKAGPGVGAVGMMLASAGLLGDQRGQIGGVAMGAAGGFLAAGPIGAAVGGAIGIGEMLAGVETPRREAIRLAKSIYHITIGNSAADQIVSIANSSYGGRVSLAVRSPEVRHMLGLYAAGTGQGSIFQQSSNDPHGASLVESGGRLQQQATYQYGQAFSQSSDLPIYGGTPTHVLGAPGGMNLSLNIGGQDAAKFLTGNVVTPDVIQGQYASAMYSSSGRVSQSLMMSEPGSIVS